MQTKPQRQPYLRLAVKYVLLVGALPIANLAHGAPADDVMVLIDQGKSLQAYALGKQTPNEPGKPDFDFHYGIAAIDAATRAPGSHNDAISFACGVTSRAGREFRFV